MKVIIVSALIYTLAGNQFAFSEQTAAVPAAVQAVEPQQTGAFEEQLAFHRRNIDVLWDQYQRGLERIVQTPGNHAELNRQEAQLTAGFRNDIARGVRVAESEQAIARIASRYLQKHTQRNAAESREVKRLQQLLCQQLAAEKRLFEQSKKQYAAAINEQTRPLLREVEARFTQLISRAEALHTSV